MPDLTLPRSGAQSFAHLSVVPSTAHNRRRQAQIRSRQQQQRERLELRALALGARYDLAQLAADAWLQGVQP